LIPCLLAVAIVDSVEVTKNEYTNTRELESFVNGANAPIFGIDVNGCLNEWNECSARLTGFTKEEVYGNHLVQTYITKEYRSSVNKVLERALEGHLTESFEFPLYTKAGRRLEVLVNANPRRNIQDKVIGVVGVGQDITARIAQEQEYRKLIDSANAPIFGIDSNNLVNEWNQKTAEITRYSKEEVCHR
jgi:PAS domain S-box-containing protein